jgi:uncharacterized protein YcfL
MRKFYLIFISLTIISCETEEQLAQKAAMEKVADSYGILIDKAKETEAFLQKQADSITRQFDSLGVPK